MAIEFHTQTFDGPLDLLLSFIQKAEVNIYDIPIASITDQFLEYLHHAKEVGLGDLSEFYKMAAELLWIKSQMMLPVEVEFDEEYVDPREELVERLLEYSKYKKYTELLMGNDANNEIVIERKPSEFVLPFSDSELWEDVTVKDLLDTYLQMLKNLDSIDEKVFNVYEEVSENEKIALLNELLDKKETIKFSDLIVNMKSAQHIICSFLAVLEAIKDKMIIVEQPKLFGEMTISKRPIDWNPNLADDYDSEYDEIVKNHLEDSDNFNIEEDEDVNE